MQKSTVRLVISVTDEKPWRIVSSIQRHSVSRVELLQPVTLFAEVAEVLASLVEFEDVIARVAVRKHNVAIRCDGDRSRCKSLEIKSGLFGKRQLQHNIASLGVKFNPLGGRVTRSVDELVVTFSVNLKIMNVLKSRLNYLKSRHWQ